MTAIGQEANTTEVCGAHRPALLLHNTQCAEGVIGTMGSEPKSTQNIGIQAPHQTSANCCISMSQLVSALQPMADEVGKQIDGLLRVALAAEEDEVSWPTQYCALPYAPPCLLSARNALQYTYVQWLT